MHRSIRRAFKVHMKERCTRGTLSDPVAPMLAHLTERVFYQHKNKIFEQKNFIDRRDKVLVVI